MMHSGNRLRGTFHLVAGFLACFLIAFATAKGNRHEGANQKQHERSSNFLKKGASHLKSYCSDFDLNEEYNLSLQAVNPFLQEIRSGL